MATAPVRVRVVQEFTKPVDRVFEYLAEHENLQGLFGPAKVKRLNDGTDGTRNGIGSARELKIGPLPSFVETVTAVVPNERIEYTITAGSSPIKDHYGTMLFSSTPSGGSKLEYTIAFNSKLPGMAGVIAGGLKKNLSDGLKKVDGRA